MKKLVYTDIKSKQGFILGDFLFSNETIQEDINEILIARAEFDKISMNNKKISNSTIKQTKFLNCYLRNTSFHNVDFTGSKFINCNLEKATFSICNLNYVEFSKCKINIDEILDNLPSQTNLRINILKQLLINQTEMADTKSCHRLLTLIAEEERKDYKNRFSKKTNYYKDLSFLERASALLNYILQSLNSFIWGYGLKVEKLIRFALLNIIFFALLFALLPLNFVDKLDNYKIRELTFSESIFQSISLFSSNGYGELVPHGILTNSICYTESAIGLIFIGFLVSAIYRRISK